MKVEQKMSKKIIRILIVCIVIPIALVLYIMWTIDHAMKEMESVRDRFFNAVINRNFDELDQIMADDAWFVAQERSYNVLREGIQENFETFEIIVDLEDITIRSDIPGRKSLAPNFNKMIVDYEAEFAEENSERIYWINGRIDITRMKDGTYKVTQVNLEVMGLEGTSILDIEEDIFGPIS